MKTWYKKWQCGFIAGVIVGFAAVSLSDRLNINSGKNISNPGLGNISSKNLEENIAKPPPQNSSTQPYSEAQNFPGFTLPKQIVGLMDSSLFHRKSAISVELASKLLIDEDQFAQINSFIRATLPKLHDREALNSSLKEDSSGNRFFQISPFDSEDLMKELKTGMRNILKDDRADLIGDLMRNSSSFGYFGRFSQELSIMEIDIPGAGKSTQMEVKFENPGQGLSSRYTLGLGDPTYIESRFGKIYSQHGLSLSSN